MRKLLPALLLAATAAHAGDPREELVAGVERIGRPGVPGPLALTGDAAFAVAATRLGDGTVHPVVAAADYGRGRVVAFGHGGYFVRGTLDQLDTGRLVRNAAAWAARGRPRVSVQGLPDLAVFLRTQGFEVSDRGLAALDACDLCCLGGVARREDERAVAAFVRRGGGLLVAGLVWGWQQLHPDLHVERDFRLNALLAPMGLCFADGYAGEILPLRDLSDCHALRALDRIAQGGREETSLVMSAYRALPEDDGGFRDRVRRLVRGAGGAVPTAEHPLREKGDGLARLALLVRHRDRLALPPAKVEADPCAADFPGAVPKGAPRVTRTVVIDAGIPGWAGTGLWAPAGDVVRLKVHGDTDPAPFRVRIGSHTDRLWDLPEWRRHPDLSRSFPLARRTEVASPFGGLLYVEVPPRAPAPPLRLEVSGAVLAPRFVLGSTDPAEWRARVRDFPAPWAELENGRLALTVRAEDARRLDDPTELLAFWEKVLGLYAELGQRPLAVRPERMVADRQISAGWLHSGYPIMMHLPHSAEVIDLALLRDAPADRSPGWGFWHELGHNHQQPDWTFAGTGEVTCNLFSLYVDDRVRGIAPADSPWARGARERAQRHFAGGGAFAAWQKDPGVALWTFILLQRDFGWDAFRKVFAEYAALPESARPRTDDAKRDQLLVRFSRAVGRDLGPYFAAWGIPVSPAARAEVAGLKPWLPAFD